MTFLLANLRFLGMWLCTLLALISTASAQLVLYDNGTMLTDGDAWAITGPFSVSNSFTLSGSSTIQVINVGVTAQENLEIGGLTWALGTTEFGGELRGPTVSDPDFVKLATEGGYDYYMSTIYLSVPVEVADAGTYWLTLSDAYIVDDPIHEVYWVQSTGTSLAWQMEGSDPPEQLSASQSFAIVGVPEPSAAALILGGVTVLAVRRRRGAPTGAVSVQRVEISVDLATCLAETPLRDERRNPRAASLPRKQRDLS